MPYIGASLHIIIAIFFAIHAIRNRHEIYWLMILFLFPLFGSIVYFIAVYLPDSRLQHGVRKVTVSAIKSLDTGRDLREALHAFELTPSAQNQMRLAAAYLDSGDPQQAAQQYEACLKGPFSNEREILFGAAKARLENDQAALALELLIKIRNLHPEFRKEAITLLFALVYAKLGNTEEARIEFTNAVTHYGSVEAYAEYAIWALSIGDQATADAQQIELEKKQRYWNSANHAMYKPIMKKLNAAFSAARNS